MALLNIVFFAALVATGFAKVVVMTNCVESNDTVCAVSEVRITPCVKPKQCVLDKGSDASISIDFTPNFEASNLKTLVYWVNGGVDMPFIGFGSQDACTYTSCPTVPGQMQTLNYQLHIPAKAPTGIFPLKWKIWVDENPKNVCCFKTTIRLVKPKPKT